jgi:hypothetical protein
MDSLSSLGCIILYHSRYWLLQVEFLKHRSSYDPFFKRPSMVEYILFAELSIFSYFCDFVHVYDP